MEKNKLKNNKNLLASNQLTGAIDNKKVCYYFSKLFLRVHIF